MSKVDTIKEKYKDRIHPRTFKSFVDGDTTPTKKYLEKMCILSVTTSNPTKRIIETIKKFDSLLPYIENKDIYHKDYDSLPKIFNVLKCAENDKEEKSFIREDHFEVLIDNEEYILGLPKTLRGSLKYGADTRWCTASRNGEHTFNRYSKTGYLVYLIRKNKKGNNWDKVAFYLEYDESIFGRFNIFNSADSQVHGKSVIINSDWKLHHITEVYSKIQSYVYKKEVLRLKKVKADEFIKNFNKLDLTSFLESILFLKNSSNEPTEDLVKIQESFLKLTSKIKEFENELG